jgi:hypothetical protein
MAGERRIFIYGSCVSRDAFAMYSDGFKLATYIARSSFASQFASKSLKLDVEDFDENNLVSSAFQKRMVNIDINKKAMSNMKRLDYDLVMIDFIDERFKLAKYQDSFYTFSTEAQKTNFHEANNIKFYNINNEEREKLWQKGFTKAIKFFTENNIPIFLIKTYWVKSEKNANLDAYNNQLDKMYDFASKFKNIKFIEYNEEQLVSDPNHKWGSMPFHYVPKFYKRTMNVIRKLS